MSHKFYSICLVQILNDQHTYTYQFDKVTDRIAIPVEIINPCNLLSIPTLALIDTGATCCGVTNRIANELHLESAFEEDIVTSLKKKKDVPVYFVKMLIDNKQISIKSVAVECEEPDINNEIGAVIGMNFLSKCDFNVLNSNGKTTFTLKIFNDKEKNNESSHTLTIFQKLKKCFFKIFFRK